MIEKCIRCNQSYNTDQETNSVCPYCGMIQGLLLHKKYLPEDYVLAKRYKIIKAMNNDARYNVYQGWDIDDSVLVQIREFYPQYVSSTGDNFVMIGSAERDWYGNIILTDKFEKEKNTYCRWLEKRKIIRDKYRRLQSRFDHDSIIFYYDIVDENNTIYEIRRYVKGLSLFSMVSSRVGGFKYDEIFRELYKAFVLIFRKIPDDIIYMGLTPGDILIEQDTENVFILSKDSEILKEDIFKYDRMNDMGEYDPPEMYSGLDLYGEYSEVYRFAAIMNYALTGRKPVGGSKGVASLSFPSDIGKTLPEGVEEALRKALIKDYKERTQDMRSFACGALPEQLVLPPNTSWNIKIDVLGFSTQMHIELSNLIHEYSIKHIDVSWTKLLKYPDYSCFIQNYGSEQIESFFKFLGKSLPGLRAVASGHFGGSRYAWEIFGIHDTGGEVTLELRYGDVVSDEIWYT